MGFWTSKRVLVTGNHGYKGSVMVAKLIANGAVVQGYCFEPQSNEILHQNMKRVGLAATYQVVGDVRDQDLVSRTIAQFRPEIVFHFAAQPLVGVAKKSPLETVEINVMGTANLADAALKAESVRVLVVAATDKVYRNEEQNVAFSEKDLTGGLEVYSASKSAQEHILNAFARNHNLHGAKVVSVRAGNVVGGLDRSAGRIFSDIERAVLDGSALAIRNPMATRPWFHVSDAIDGYLEVGRSSFLDPMAPSYLELNLGAWGNPVSVGELIQLAKTQVSSLKVHFTEGDFFESQTLALDSNLAQSRLGWKAKRSHSEAVMAGLGVVYELATLGEGPAFKRFLETVPLAAE